MEFATEKINEGWSYLITRFSPDDLITHGTLITHEIFFFASFIPWYICDMIPQLKKYKIQPDKKMTWPILRNCLKKLFITHFLIQWGMMLAFRPLMLKLGLIVSLPLPSFLEVSLTVVACFLIEDFYFYWVHRLLHHPAWYKYIHKVHHEHAAPFGIAAEYAHPLETLLLGVGSVAGPIMITRHLFTLWVWLACRLYQTVEAHAGYDLPWNFTKIIPGWGGPHFHDFHHETFKGNYSSTFTYLDWVFGTSQQYYERQASLSEKAVEPKKQA